MVSHRRYLLILLTLVAWAAANPARAGVKRSPLDRYKVVNDRNLFRPLGWQPPNPAPQYTVLMTVLAAPPQAKVNAEQEDFLAGMFGRAPQSRPTPPPTPRQNRALIAQVGSNTAFYVAVGEKIGNLTVTLIEKGRVRLEGEGGKDAVDLRMSEMNFPGGGGAGPSGPGGPPSMGAPPPGGRRQGGQQNDGQGRQMRERFQNMSPEEREKMREQFRQRSGGEVPGGPRN